MKDFTRIEYLKHGNIRQKDAYRELMDLRIFENLKEFKPILVGTIPIDIDIPESDLDIICVCEDHLYFAKMVSEYYSQHVDFSIKTYIENGCLSTVSSFRGMNFEIEIFGQNIQPTKQYAYRHMIVEEKILNACGLKFKQEIKALKSQGLKTEPAFAQRLGLKGNPYEALLTLENEQTFKHFISKNQ